MQDDEIVEVMARGLFADSPQSVGWTWANCGGGWRDYHRHTAKTALAALRAHDVELIQWRPIAERALAEQGTFTPWPSSHWPTHFAILRGPTGDTHGK